MKNSLEGYKRRFEQAEKIISKLENKSTEIIHFEEKQQEKRIRTEQSLRDLWDTIKYIILVSEEQEKKQEAEKIFEEMVENSPNLIKDKSNTQEAQQIASMTNLRSMSRHILTKVSIESQLQREYLLKAAKEKQLTTQQ